MSNGWGHGLLAVACLLGLAQPVSARGDEPEGDRARPLPDYDGRGPAPQSPGRGLLIVPRILVSPLYFVSEFIVRRPMGYLIRASERDGWIGSVASLFRHRAGLLPTFAIDLAFVPRVGAYLYVNDVGSPDNQIRATGSFWTHYVSIIATDRYRIDGGKGQLSLRGHYGSRSDNVFFGLGPESRRDDLSRYQMQILDASGAGEWHPSGGNRLRLEAGYRSVWFGDGTCCSDPSLADEVAAGTYPMPPGFAEDGYAGPFTRLTLMLDSRETSPGTGVGANLQADQGSDIGRGWVWLRGNATLFGSLDVTGTGRVVSLSLNVQLSGPVAGDLVPFTEQISLGGGAPLAGFGGGRLIGRSAVALTAQYEWPIWAYAVGALHLGVGNVFAPALGDFDTELLRMSTGIGFRSSGDLDHHLELMVGFGTDTFAGGAGIDWVRVALGGVTGF